MHVAGNFCFSFVSSSLAYITYPNTKDKQKLTERKKLTVTYTLCVLVFHAFLDIETIPGKEKICQWVPVPTRVILA